MLAVFIASQSRLFQVLQFLMNVVLFLCYCYFHVFCSRYTVFKGTPGFIIVVKDSDFAQKFIKKYKLAT